MQLNFAQAQQLQNSINAARNNEPYPFTMEELDLLQRLVTDSLLYDVSSELRSVVVRYLQQIKNVEVIEWNQKKSELIFYIHSFDVTTQQIDIDNPLITSIVITHISFRTGQYVPIWQNDKFLERGKI